MHSTLLSALSSVTSTADQRSTRQHRSQPFEGISPAYLYMAVKLHEDAGLAGEQKLPELELRHHACFKYSVSRLPPGGRKQLRHILTRSIATCNRVACPCSGFHSS